ncbi:antibiotic biosynthesis monooxygenase [Streptomyces sp. NPDC048623]|uniref:antibiotic biosynthesis monooxygenase n=1 Tax=Streptomyces sp. NPDC048623 TaxID=3155761 RepID=UPI003426B682
MTITATARQLVKPGCESRLDALMTDLERNIRAHEPGCLRFDYVVSADRPGERLVIEEYADEAALEFHKHTPYLAEFIPQLLDCLTEPPLLESFRPADGRPALPESAFHIGVVVPDLAEATELYSSWFGIEFAEPATFEIPYLEQGGQGGPARMTAVFSRTSYPQYELIQADGDGITSLEHAGKVLYYGVWEADMAARVKKLEAEGVGIDAYFRPGPGETPFAVITAPDLQGVRVEYVGLEDRPAMDEWVATGRYPGLSGR